jgi:hypothetical protein
MTAKAYHASASGHEQGAQNEHEPITDREDVDPAGHRTAGRARAPGQSRYFTPDVRRAVLLEDVVGRTSIQKLLGAVVECLLPHHLCIWIDELHIFGIGSLDCRPAGVAIAL